jgi:Fic family protein
MRFRPAFVVSDSVDRTAGLINRPHEDYPKRLDATRIEIESLVRDRLVSTLREDDILQMHARVMWDLEKDLGQWRTCNVTVGGDYPPNWRYIPEQIERSRLFPVSRSLITEPSWASMPWLWYAEFQRIHPFRDGNGRVGGIVLAWLTFNPSDHTMLAPLQ